MELIKYLTSITGKQVNLLWRKVIVGGDKLLGFLCKWRYGRKKKPNPPKQSTRTKKKPRRSIRKPGKRD